MRAVPAISLTQVCKAYADTTVLNKLSLDIQSGQIYVLLGANGAGKTTTLRMIVGLTRADSGTISVLGRDIEHDPAFAKNQIAYLPDDPLVYDLLKPMEYLDFVAGLWRVDKSAAQSRGKELLISFGLWEHRHKLARDFSHGMRQKLALAGALIHTPKILILDEPLTGLDVTSAQVVKKILLELSRSGVCIVLTTHILEVAEKMGDQIGLMANGALVTTGSLADLHGRYPGNVDLEGIFVAATTRSS